MTDRADERCYELDDLESLLALDPDDPRRGHLERCPRCRARLLVYEEFIGDRSVPPGADTSDAAVRLRWAFDEERDRRIESGAPRRSPWAWLSARLRPRALRPAWALAAILIAAGALYAGLELRATREAPDLLRRQPAPGLSSRSPARIELRVPSIGPGGAVTLRWHPFPQADSYRVHLMDADLADFARLGPVADTTLFLSPDAMPGGIHSGAVVGWEVAALRAGQEIARSGVSTIRLP